MDSLDLDLKHYDFDELLNIFKIDEYNSSIDYQSKLTRKTDIIVDKYPKHIGDFFIIAKNAILAIFSLIENKIILESQVDEYFEKIQQISNLKEYSDSELINLLINQNDLTELVHGSRKILKEPNVLDPTLNKPHDSSSTERRVDPRIDFKNNTHEILQTFSNGVAPGSLNAIKRITQMMNINLNSCFRKNYFQTNPCDFLYTFPDEIKNVLSMRLVSLEIPNAWYLITDRKQNNKFEIEIMVGDKFEKYVIKIPDGNYCNETFQDYMNTHYFYESGVETLMKYLKIEIFTTDLRTRLCVIEEECFPAVSFTARFVENEQQNIMNTLGWLLGFRRGVYSDIYDCVQSEGLFDAGGDRYIYLSINDFQYNNNQSNIVCFDRSNLKEEVIAKIPMLNGKLSMIINDNTNVLAKIRRYNGPVNLSKLQIKVLDKFGNVIDLNQMDYSLTLEMEILYENFNFKNVAT